MNRSLISHVLLAEGNAEHQFLLLRALKTGRSDLEVTVVDTGVELLRMLHQHTYDCVVMAYELPDHKAPELLELAHDIFEKCPAVVVSSGVTQEEVIETFRHGAVDFVPKNRAIKGDELWIRLEASAIRYQSAAKERRESERRERHLAHLAETDQLTGLNNRRYLNRCWTANRWANDRRQYLGCVMADLDHFKKINDTFGHAAGDAAIKAVAATMKESVGSDGSTVRWGGEELLAVCSASDVVNLWSWAEHLRMRIESLMIESGPSRFHVTTSIGVVLSDRSDFDPETVELADRSMYLAKEWGRNQVCTNDMAEIASVLQRVATQGGESVETVRQNFLTNIQRLLGPTQFKHVTGHCERVRHMAARIATEMGLDDQTVDDISLAGLLHDIGKVMIPEELLAKPQSLAISEWRFMDKHCVYSHWIAKQLGANDAVISYCRDHHDRFDADVIAQPEGHEESSTSLGSRIICVADALVTMISTRTYRNAMPMHAALNELRRHQGTQFDPGVVDVTQGFGERKLRLAA